MGESDKAVLMLLATEYWGQVGDQERWICRCCGQEGHYLHGGEEEPRDPLEHGWIIIRRDVPPYRKSLLICPECQKAIKEEFCNADRS